MRIWLNNELDNLEDYFGLVARETQGRNSSHYDNFRWYNRGKEERKMRRLVEHGNVDEVVLYRYIPVTQLWQMITNQKISLISPLLWKDPLESPLFNAKIKRKGRYTESPFKERYFAQCFTINDTSESMWKTYGNGEPLARIKIKVGALRCLIDHNQEEYNRNDFYLGRVVYLNFEDIKELFQNGYRIEKAFRYTFFEDQAKSLLVKRYAYSFEKEVRLIYDSQDRYNQDRRRNIPKVVSLEIPDISNFISEILLDPDMAAHDVEFYKSAWRHVCGNNVLKNNLYSSSDYQLKIQS